MDEALLDGISALWKGTAESSPHPLPPHKHTVIGQLSMNQEAAPSPDTQFVGVLILDLQDQEVSGTVINFCCL